jgi:hypothetical protein
MSSQVKAARINWSYGASHNPCEGGPHQRTKDAGFTTTTATLNRLRRNTRLLIAQATCATRARPHLLSHLASCSPGTHTHLILHPAAVGVFLFFPFPFHLASHLGLLFREPKLQTTAEAPQPYSG